MQKDTIITGYTEAANDSIGLYKTLADTTASLTDKMRMSMLNMKDVAELGKTSLEFYNNINRMTQSLLNKQIQHQLGVINLKESSDSVKEFNEIYTETIRRMMENLMGIGNIYVESSAEHLEKLKNAKSMQDITVTMMHMLSEIQGKMKDNAVAMLCLMESVKANMTAWTEKAVEKIADSNAPTQ